MLNINFLKNTSYFKELTLKKSEVLFDEGDIDNNIYIIIKGSLLVEKYTSVEKIESKQLAILKKNDIFGEGSLKESKKKQVKIKAIKETVLLKIDCTTEIQKLIKEYPLEGIELLVEIIDLSNKRLLESNFLVTSIYRISKLISELKVYNNKNLFSIIDEFKKIIGVTYIIYIEKNTVISNYITVKYDTRKTGKMQNSIIELNNGILNTSYLKENGINVDNNNYIKNLKNKNNSIGYLVIGNNLNDISEGQKKVISSISTLISGIIIQKQLYEEEFNKEYINNQKK